jgi:hypothetical protein
MATKNLDEVRAKLYQAFDNAISAYGDMSMSGANTHEKVVSKSQALGAAAQVAQALTSVEHEIAVLDWIKESRARGDNIAAEMDKGLVKSSVPLGTIKLKPPGS